jgi:hypothetical protein
VCANWLLGYYRLGLHCSLKEDSAAARPSLSEGPRIRFHNSMSTLFSRGRIGVAVVNAHELRQGQMEQKRNGHP